MARRCPTSLPLLGQPILTSRSSSIRSSSNGGSSTRSSPAVEVLAGAVVAHGGGGVGVACGYLDVAEVDAGVGLAD